MRDEKDKFVGKSEHIMSLVKSSNCESQNCSTESKRINSGYPEMELNASDFLKLRHQIGSEATRKISIDEKIEYLKKELDFIRRTSRKLS